MRATSRLFASVKPGRFLEPNTQTGLTGLLTHPSPRPTLIFVYNTILDKLKALPETSMYRQSTESLTKSRLAIVQSVKPPGYDEWAARAKKIITDNPVVFESDEPITFPKKGTQVRFAKNR